MKLKNVTLSLLLGAAILLFAISCNGYECEDCKDTYCDNCYPDLVVRNRSMPITGLLDGNRSATVKGIFNKADLNAAAVKIKAAINAGYEDALIPAFEHVFDHEDGITIIVEKNPSYENYSTTTGGTIIRINYTILNNASALKEAIKNAISVITDASCECEDLDHLGIGEKCCYTMDCTCTPKVYGEISDDIDMQPLWTFPIYRQGAVNDMTAAVAKAVEAFGGLDEMNRAALYGNIKEVRIIPGNTASRSVENGKFVIELGEDNAAFLMRNWFQQAAAAVGELTP